MSGKWIAAILVIVAAGVVVYLIINGSGELPGMSDDNVVGWTWSGEMARGANGSWIPFKK